MKNKPIPKMEAPAKEEIDELTESDDSSSESEGSYVDSETGEKVYNVNKTKFLWFKDIQIRYGWTVTSYFVLLKLMVLFFLIYGFFSFLRFLFYLVSVDTCEPLFYYKGLNYTTDLDMILKHHQETVDDCLLLENVTSSQLRQILDSRNNFFQPEWYRCLSVGFASYPMDWLHGICLFLSFLTIFIVIQLGFPRYQSRTMKKCSKSQASAADFTLTVSGFPEADTEPEELQHFLVELGFGVHSIRMLPRSRRYYNLLYQRGILENNLYRGRRKKSFLFILTCLSMFNSCIVDNFTTIENSWAVLFGNIYELKQRVNEMNKIIKNMEENNLKWYRKAFVTFTSFEDAAYCLEYFNRQRVLRFMKFMPIRMFKPQKRLLFKRIYMLHFRRSPETSDFLWQNMGVKGLERMIRRILTIGISVYVMLCFIAWQVNVQQLATYGPKDAKNAGTGFYKSPIGQAVTSILLALMENVIETTLEFASTFVRHHTNSDTQHARVFWYTLVRVLTVFVLLNAVYDPQKLTWKCYFYNVSGLFHQMMFFSVLTSIPMFPMLKFMFYFAFYVMKKYILRKKYLKFGAECLRRSEFRYAKNISFILSRYILLLYYGVHFPLPVLFVAITYLIFYILERINFSFFYHTERLRMNKIPSFHLYFFFGFLVFVLSMFATSIAIAEGAEKNVTKKIAVDYVSYAASEDDTPFWMKIDKLYATSSSDEKDDGRYVLTILLALLIVFVSLLYIASWIILGLIKIIRCEPFFKTKHSERFLRTKKIMKKKVKKQFRSDLSQTNYRIEVDDEDVDVLDELIYEPELHGEYELPFNCWAVEDPIYADEAKRERVRLEIMMQKKKWKKIEKARQKGQVEMEEIVIGEESAPPVNPLLDEIEIPDPEVENQPNAPSFDEPDLPPPSYTDPTAPPLSASGRTKRLGSRVLMTSVSNLFPQVEFDETKLN